MTLIYFSTLDWWIGRIYPWIVWKVCFKCILFSVLIGCIPECLAQDTKSWLYWLHRGLIQQIPDSHEKCPCIPKSPVMAIDSLKDAMLVPFAFPPWRIVRFLHPSVTQTETRGPRGEGHVSQIWRCTLGGKRFDPKRRGDLRLVHKEGSRVLPSFEDARLAGLGSDTTEVIARWAGHCSVICWQGQCPGTFGAPRLPQEVLCSGAVHVLKAKVSWL